jgi:ATP-binding protein involved in chromosome partitioning
VEHAIVWARRYPFAPFRALRYHSLRMASEQDVLDALRGIKDPDSQQDIVALGLVRDLAVRGGEVTFTLAFAAQPPQTKVLIHSMANKLVGRLPGVAKVNAKMGGGGAAAPPQQQHQHGGHTHGAPQRMGAAQRPADLIPEVKHTIAVSSGKGGVGKSTVAVNLALALRGTGAAVGIIDADVYGPDLPLMLGTRGRPGMFENRILPVEAHGLKVMSIGLLVGDREPLVWRGPMIHSFIQQMLRDVLWGALDYLVFDMPPGTGDAQLSLSQVIPLSGVVMVTTPQDVALLDVRKAIAMFQRLNVPILGVVENMSYFVAPDTGTRYAIFGEGGGRKVADEYGVPLLGQLPLDPDTRKGGDEGAPITVRRPDSPQTAAFREVARRVIERLEATATLRPLPSIS